MNSKDKVFLATTDDWAYTISSVDQYAAADRNQHAPLRAVALQNATGAIADAYPDLAGRVALTSINRDVIRTYEESWMHAIMLDPRYMTARCWANDFTFYDQDEDGKWLAINRYGDYGRGGDKIVNGANRFETGIWVDDKLCAISIGGLPTERGRGFTSVIYRLASPHDHPLRGRAFECMQMAATAHAAMLGNSYVYSFGPFSPGARKSYDRMGLTSQTEYLPSLKDGINMPTEVYVTPVEHFTPATLAFRATIQNLGKPAALHI